MKVELDPQGTHQLLTGPPGGSQQAAPLLDSLPPAQAALHLALPHSKHGEDEWAPRGNDSTSFPVTRRR